MRASVFHRLNLSAVLIAILCLGATADALGQEPNVLQVGNQSAKPGDAGVRVPIHLESDVDLTRLTFDLLYGDAPITVVDVRRAGRTLKSDPQDWSDDGQKVRISLFLLGDTVIPAGEGQILEVILNVLPDAVPGGFPMSVSGFLEAQQGPVPVNVEREGGVLAIQGPGGPLITPLLLLLLGNG